MSLLLALPGGRSLEVEPGPCLLAGASDGPGLDAHVHRHGDLPSLGVDHLVALLEAVDLRGRGGAGFPFSRKLRTATRRRGRAVVVVNLGEGEPASHKDAALARVAPHLVLDGAVSVAAALGTHEVHLVLPGDRPDAVAAVHRALDDRSSRRLRDDRVRWRTHEAGTRFVAGQSAAVLELMAGNPNLPVTTWQPTAQRGHRGRPTVLSNAETYAHVAATVLHDGGPGRDGTTLLSLDGDTGSARVREVRTGVPWTQVLSPEEIEGPVLLGGYHGTWAPPGALSHHRVARDDLAAAGLTLGAGVVLPLRAGCPVVRTADVVAYLGAESAGRCGPCVHGLPALAAAVVRLARPGTDRAAGDPAAEARRLTDLVHGRGACAHPDGTARLVRSLLSSYPDEVAAHVAGSCTCSPDEARARRTVPA